MSKEIDLEIVADKLLLEKGFVPNFSDEIKLELEKMTSPALPHDRIRDLKSFLWISIDNEDSKDLDQLTFAENGKIYVAIANVDDLVKRGSAIDQRAEQNTTSVYTPAKVFTMLPPKLSYDLTSLNENKDRCAIVVEVKVEEDGEYKLESVTLGIVQNKAKLNYPCVGAWLEHQQCKDPLPEIDGLKDQLFLQDKLAQKIHDFRAKQGALDFEEIELKAVMENGVPISIEERQTNRAHKLIENFMIAANVAVTRFLKAKNSPTIMRIVKKPKRWDRIVKLAKDIGEELAPEPDQKALRKFLLKQQKKSPETFPDLSIAIIKLLGRGEYVVSMPGELSPGHFDLAESEYCHSTAPNRRFPDLIIQRLIKASLLKREVPYTEEELILLAAHCSEKEKEADKIQRQLTKCAAAVVMQKEIGKTFHAMVTGSAPKGTWVRLDHPRIEGKLVKGFEGVDVGDHFQVKLTRVNVYKGHLDFEKVANE